jgi:undecaprenyl-diphosphatase
MISIFQAIILGTVQGLTEFLPVSSSAHLILVPWLLRWPEPGLAFDVVLHLGSLLALLAYYWRDWVDMGMSLVDGRQMPRRLLFFLVVASVPGAIIGVLLEKQAETIFRSPVLIATTLSVMGIALWASDSIGSKKRKIEDITFVDALLIGLSQALAIIPGVSRSGATITTARLLGIDRPDAANFSYLMATPIIAGAGLLEVRKLFHSGLVAQLGWGFIASAVFSILAIAGLLRFVRTRTYQPFAIYRILVGIAVVAIVMSRR